VLWLDLVLAVAALVVVINVLAVLVVAGASRAHARSIDPETRRPLDA
jgi:hypothetical protein